jgi:acyl dehydratase
MKIMALLLHDPNPIHFDPASVASFGPDARVINQGPISLGYVVTMLSAWLGGVSGITSLHCRYLANVRAEDAVVVGGEIVSVDPAGSAACRVWLEVEDGVRALEGTATVVLPADDA